MYNISGTPTLFKKCTNEVIQVKFIIIKPGPVRREEIKRKRRKRGWKKMIVGAKYWNHVATVCTFSSCSSLQVFHVETGTYSLQFFIRHFYKTIMMPITSSPPTPPPPAQSPHQCIIHKQLITKAKPTASTLNERAVQRPQPHKRNVSLMTDYSTFFVS